MVSGTTIQWTSPYTKCVPQVFDLQVYPSKGRRPTELVVNEQPLVLAWHDTSVEDAIAQSPQLTQILSIPDTYGALHRVKLSWSGLVGSPSPDLGIGDDETQNIHFTITPFEIVRPAAGFTAIMRPQSPRRLVGLIPDSSSRIINFEHYEEVTYSSETALENGDYHTTESDTSDDFDLGAELESLGLLEDQAQQLQTQIAAKKKAIAENLKQERDKLCLKHLIKECDGIVCCAQAIAQRICDKVGISTGPSLQYAHMKDAHAQNRIALDEKFSPQKASWHNCTDGHDHCADAANIPLMVTKVGPQYAFKPIDLVNPPNPLLRALQIVAAILGLSALFAFIRKRCMSMRKRVERAADLEERRNARAYRRAARRALMRKRWDNFVNAVNCFRPKDARIEDYEEKRALILQDAFLEQDLDQAEKGEVMEAEIRELRYAHEIVSSLVRRDQNRYDLITPVNDPPPPLVPLPYTPIARSRASTFTLPSYTSESLPDYTSRPGDADTSSSLGDEFTPSISDENDQRSPVSPISDSSSHTGYTPDSSIIEASTRPSQETLRTRPS